MNADSTKRIDPRHEGADVGALDDELEDEGVSEEEIEEFLVQVIRIGADLDEEGADYQGKPIGIATFEDRGVLTANRGLVVTIGDHEFQLTIVRSR